DVCLDPADEPPDAGDLLRGGGGVGARPFIDAVDGGGQALAGAQEVVEVGGQAGQVGDVGAEVVAACAAEPDGAGTAAGLNVGRLGAGAVGDGGLADPVACVPGFQERAGVTPDAVAVPVELHGGDLVDGLAAAGFADPVVPLGCIHDLVVHQLAEHVDRDAGIGVTLGVGVPVAVRDDLGLAELGTVAGQQGRELADPAAVPQIQGSAADRTAPGRGLPEQWQLSAQLPLDLGGQVPAGLGPLGLGGDVAVGEGKIITQPGGGAAGAGQPEHPDPCQYPPHIPADLGPLCGAARTGRS